MKYHTYIIYSAKVGRYYIGATGNLEDRLLRHRQGRSKATRSGAPDWELVYKEVFASKSEAVVRELFLKRMKSRVFLEWLIRRQNSEEKSDHQRED